MSEKSLTEPLNDDTSARDLAILLIPLVPVCVCESVGVCVCVCAFVCVHMFPLPT